MGTLSLSSSLKPSLVSSRLNSSSSASSSSFPKPNSLHLKPTKLVSPPLRTTSPSPLRFANASSIEMSQTQESAIRGAESDVMGLLLRERIVFLGSGIDDFVADAIMSQLLLLDAKDPKKDIKLFINSPGGSLSATMAIYDVVQLVRADVSTIALGIAASTASIILGAGTKGKRFAMPNTRIMIHQPLGGASGQAIDVEIQAKEVMHNKNNVTSIIAGCTSRSFEQVLKDIDRDRYMSPIEAVEYGLIDGVIDGDSIIPLEPVPDRVKPRVNYEEISKDPMKFLTPEIPDDEIY
ncbi:PREDICTED: ATP-dependent Clp protease proteolytic subunit 4, chloroplastic [Camelina sativa]|uniref:ATP-dependent Clp protease proteolytic subunit n=1 Tax=Camelina sativa TaxID=90675 RepID=A0ABM0UIR1_CAMSA|nr:PREDICTED: ATP-dependent Clp protease proteolytic subunit 4, chloroplastic [Camelina sativa]